MEQIYRHIENEPITVLRVLRNVFGFSKHEISRLKFQNGLNVNGHPVYVNYIMKKGDELTVSFHEETHEIIDPGIQIEILYEDEDCVVLNKPAGVTVHPSHGHLEDSLGTALQAHYAKQGRNFTIRAVGRLDKDVSGAVVFAKNQPSASRLNAQQADGRMKKTYMAFAQGHFEPCKGTINAPILKVEGSKARIIDPKGQSAITHYCVKEESESNGVTISVVEVRLETGRTHQIRVHMAGLNHPLLGDSLYGGERTLLKRVGLHCRSIEFVSPFRDERVTVSAPFPEDLQKLKKTAS